MFEDDENIERQGTKRPAGSSERRPVNGQRRPASAGSANGQRRPASAGGAAGQRRPASAGSANGQRRPASAGSANGQRRPASASGAAGQKRPASAGSANGQRRPASASGANGQRRPASAGSANGQRRPASAGAAGQRRPAGATNRPVNKSANGDVNERKLREIEKMREKNKKTQQIVIISCIALVALLLVIGICYSVVRSLNGKDDKKAGNNSNSSVTSSVTKNDKNDKGDKKPGNDKADPTPEPTPTEAPKEVKIVAVGDDLVHTGVFRAGLQDDGTHDYSCLFANVKGYLDNADMKVLNQETIFAGDDLGLQSYPNFNSPTAIGDCAVNAGFNVFTHATNHALDMGIDGLLNCAKWWKTSHPDTMVVGIYETPEEQAQIPVMEINGIKFALLNYTYSHNWETFSSSAEGHLNMLCAYDESTRYIDFDTINPQVIEDIKAAEELADFTIVFPHWGTEYVTSATTQEVNFAQQMTEAGADLIIGTHPHVIQPVDWVTSENGNKALCYYSLGNFTSTQDAFERLLGGMASLTVIKDSTGTYISEESIKAIPLITHYVFPGWNGATVVDSTYSLANYTEEQASNHGIHDRCGIYFSRQDFVDLANNVFGKYCAIE